MKEEFIHYIWKTSSFEKKDLRTQDGDELRILSLGVHNKNSGPDFLQARIKINGLEWAGSVELHILASDWEVHGHQHDPAYDNCILHVCWIHDKDVYTREGQKLIALELKDRVEDLTSTRYNELMSKLDSVACKSLLPTVDELVQSSCLERMAVERIEFKIAQMHQQLELTSFDWQESLYVLLAEGFGSKVNKLAFGLLARLTPFKLILQNRDSLLKLEALLFGQAGLLEDAADDYQKLLLDEYCFLQTKYGLKPMFNYQWKHLRMRPSNFPEVKIAQFASFWFHYADVLEEMPNSSNYKALLQKFRVCPSTYWEDHYRFGKTSAKKSKRLSNASAESLLVNVVVPFYYAYTSYYEMDDERGGLLEILHELPPENNKVIRLMLNSGLKVNSLLEGQGALHLFYNYCNLKKCLSCRIGTQIISAKL